MRQGRGVVSYPDPLPLTEAQGPQAHVITLSLPRFPGLCSPPCSSPDLPRSGPNPELYILIPRTIFSHTLPNLFFVLLPWLK
jgi:hypothetical protein